MKHIQLFTELNENAADGLNEGSGETTFPLSPNRIYNVLSGSTFEKWYNKDFIDHIEGTEKSKTKEEILEDLKNMFK